MLMAILFLFAASNDPLSTATGFSILKPSWKIVTTGRITQSHIATAASDADTTATIKKPLTDRQLQFWEDVDEGLDDIESFWGKKNQNIDRIRLFALRYENPIRCQCAQYRNNTYFL
jgi:hypothetical protein